jgi:NTP pyrophosphatase (non-canonical NTP hydrolase)
MNDRTIEVIPTLLEIIRQHTETLAGSEWQKFRRELHDAAFAIAIEANSNRIEVEKILDAMAKLAGELRRRHDVLSREYDPWVALGPPTKYERAMSRMKASEH